MHISSKYTAAVYKSAPGKIFKEYTEELGGRIYTYSEIFEWGKTNKTFDYKEDLELISGQKLSGVHNGKGYLLLKNKIKSKIINVNNIIDGIGSLNIVNNGYNVIDTRKDYTWHICSINFISENRYLVKINVENQNYSHGNSFHNTT